MDTLISLLVSLFLCLLPLSICFLIHLVLTRVVLRRKTDDDAVSGSPVALGLLARSKDGQYVYESSGCCALLAGLLLGFIAPWLVPFVLLYR